MTDPRPSGAPGTTWARSHTYAARELLFPTSIEECQAIVEREPRVRALGTRHSFSDLADSPGVLVSLGALDAEPELLDDGHVRVPAGQRYGDLAVWLEQRGLALANLASLPHISVGGAVATGTHGSGVGNGSLSSAVAALEMVDGRGARVRLSRGDAAFDGAVIGVGTLGLVTSIELDVEPTYLVRQTVHEGLPWRAFLADPWAVMAAAYSVSVFTRWTGDTVGQVWVKARDGDMPLVLGADPALEQRHMIPGLDPGLTTPQLGAPGPWHERIPHFRLGFLPSSGDEIQSEYLVPREAARPALEAVRGLADRIEPLLHVSELRTVAADDLWLSGAHGTDAMALHFTWRREPEAVAALLPVLEERLLPLSARPHWGKVFAAGAADLSGLYPRWDDFAALAEHHDPDHRFVNDWTARRLGRG
ncbi:MAG TPA: D-arabinono-1,4-lactone oxidase [Nocardioides sp.]|nr:D-arabinono-1,4-lactone oxidase [Nocardioides sp.]